LFFHTARGGLFVVFEKLAAAVTLSFLIAAQHNMASTQIAKMEP
jgi:hypothetical protein